MNGNIAIDFENNSDNLYKFSYEAQFNSGGSIYIVVVDLNEYELTIKKANGNPEVLPNIINYINELHKLGKKVSTDTYECMGLIRASSELQRISKDGYAINGGFYLDIGALDSIKFDNPSSFFYGDPVGWMRVDTVDYNIPLTNRPVLKILGGHKIKICSDIFNSILLRINDVEYKISSGDNGLLPVIYPTFNYNCTTGRNPYLLEISNNEVTAIYPISFEKLDSNLQYAIVLSYSNRISVGDKIKIVDLDGSGSAITIAPTLYEHGSYTTNAVWDKEHFSSKSHPKTLTRDLFSYRAARTGIFLTSAEDRIVLAVSENNISGLGQGLTLNEFTYCVIEALSIINQHATYGYYLDGGSSSVLAKSARNKTALVNIPSGISNPEVEGYKRGEEAYLGSVLLATKRKQ